MDLTLDFTNECPRFVTQIMEQCVARLDVAMFNAILRDSDDNFPTDPVSDPIADLRVLPIPSRTSSFGSGAQLKNSVSVLNSIAWQCLLYCGLCKAHAFLISSR